MLGLLFFIVLNTKYKSEFVGLLKLLRPAKYKTGFSVKPFLVKKACGSRAAPLSLTAVSEIPLLRALRMG